MVVKTGADQSATPLCYYFGSTFYVFPFPFFCISLSSVSVLIVNQCFSDCLYNTNYSISDMSLHICLSLPTPSPLLHPQRR